MKTYCLFGLVIVLAGCSGTPRVAPAPDLAHARSVHVVVRPHGEPLIATYDSTKVTRASAFSFGFLGALVGAAIDDALDDARRAEAADRIQPLRDRLSEEVMNANTVASFSDPNSCKGMSRCFESARLGVSDNESHPEELGNGAEELMLIVQPKIGMSPDLRVLTVILEASTRNESNGVAYRSTVQCNVEVGADYPVPKFAAIWAGGEVARVENEMTLCLQGMVRVISADLFHELQTLDLIPARKRERKLNKFEPVKIGMVGPHDLYQSPGVGHLLVRTFDAVTDKVAELDRGHLQLLDEAVVLQRLESNEPAILSKLADDMLEQQVFYSRIVRDKIAAKVYAARRVTGLYVADAVAGLANVLGASGDSRYRDVLERVASSAADAKVERYARRARSKLDDKDEEQFLPWISNGG